MQQSFTKEFMLVKRGCYPEDHFLMRDITLTEIVQSGIPLKDKYWFVCRKLATREQNQEIACSLAEIVLPIFEKRYPEDKRPREAIEAARAYIVGHISLDQLLIKRRAPYAADAAAYAADDAAYAAYAAYAAASAAYAADDADYAAYAAYTAASAAYAAYAADDAAIKQQLQSYLEIFILVTELV
jgi:hypothetical protein